MTKSPIVAICLLSQQELESLGPSFDRAYPVQDAPCFGRLLQAIDEADREWWRQQEVQQIPLVL
jgi:hypothetical protein